MTHQVNIYELIIDTLLRQFLENGGMLRTRSKTFSEGRCAQENLLIQNRKVRTDGEESKFNINCSRQRKMSVFEPRSCSS